ncbi:MAG: hypothetical protein UR96_C0003G0030 [candidate division WS6 bacterium GW2011_GWC1_36_11]|uniref:Uncharacterized protein n=2 Tax=Candidatus Dojkabacteria TaxID=74243 RepID=A0A0G0DF31_9BACT|nr:MAG: hypothetical protein UR96_C0003G0030 [candidate division WS6 bacterium GW2011_GWC1_36_11]KKQ04351.1 MAG: hypothetical protein US14_C0014G0008 [candidate division WS6 bacterium GW2011_WS6_36_26]KKQ11124.1 MAG: hypothetical protein US23_C0008G0004 [candidate division WS6 bacterium GW2011_GWE1_36_69]KKQ16975.1 MAG: hypothetical protein US29_C0014G0006 [candidate division WS6 bacterium GW2011_GWF1_36_8]
MIKKIIWYLVLPLVVGLSIYLIFFNKKATPNNTETSNNTNQTETTNPDTQNEDTADSANDNEETIMPLTGFSTDEQTSGVASDAKFTIEEVTNTARTGYHEFVFSLSSTGTDDPYVVATYRSDLGVIRIDLNQIEKDSGGIGYQKAVAINNEGISQLYHNVSSDQTEELYDIGVSKSTPFTITTSKMSDGWDVIVGVQYPGEVSTENLDLGSTEFGKLGQTIMGVDATKGSTLASYTYGSNSGVLKFVWNVSSTDANPIPSVSAAYDAEHKLVVTFGSVKTDKVYLAVDGIALPGNLAMQTERAAEKSMYTFYGLTEDVDYKLSAGLSPNQVIVEIQL